MNRIGLALSGGGVKSISQLPVIRALKEQNIKIDVVAGTSMGSVIAALVACGLDSETLTDVVLKLEQSIKEKHIFTKPSAKLLPFSKEKLTGGYVDGQELEDELQKVLDVIGIHNICDVVIPLAIPAVDLTTGKVVCFVSHPEMFTITDNDWEIITDIPLAKAVRASCSFPFVIAAMEYQGYVLVDGGVRMNLPLELVEAYGVDKTIAVTMHSNEPFHEYNSLMAIATRCMDLMRIEDDYHIVKKADVHINVPLDDVWVFELGKGRFTMDRANLVLEKHKDDIKALVKKKTFWERIKEELEDL
ncbi:patatin-like phospholipase family protein [Erysipelothrix tonsillarum]|uniref:patatin-like phospholipase family protein n=1 Tax=Erysipelothrix tonsillarum TaxID=38402 RepID=UPI000362B26A|nr:patatin-like phospholipase family protein [Erysipelothrix tonsillarum]